MVSLGTLNNGRSSVATGVNSDGKVVVGYSSDGAANNSERAFRWTEAANHMISLGTLGGSYSRASGVSADGKVVVGYSAFDAGDNFDRAFRWTESSNRMESLGTLNNGGNSYANAISSDGKVIVGKSEDGSANNADRAFRWIETQGMRSLDSLLADSGVDLGGIHMSNANSTSRDGTIIVASGDNRRSYIVRLSLPQSQNATSAGVMDEENFQSSLSQAAATLTFGHRMSDLTLNGAHGKPMRSVLEDGQNSIWAGGDLARLLGDDYSGFRGLGEIGFGHGFGDGVSAQVSIGGFGEETSLDTGGEASGRMLYIVPEVGFDLRDNLRMTLTGLYGRGTLDTRRGYLNGANTDFSEGKSDVATVSARLRLDWVDAFTLQDTKITPFLSYAISRSEQSAYTETGGAFPAEWNAYSDNTHVVRTGLDATYDLDERTTLLGHIEASYGVSGDPPVTGKTIGLSSFSIPAFPLTMPIAVASALRQASARNMTPATALLRSWSMVPWVQTTPSPGSPLPIACVSERQCPFGEYGESVALRSIADQEKGHFRENWRADTLSFFNLNGSESRTSFFMKPVPDAESLIPQQPVRHGLLCLPVSMMLARA